MPKALIIALREYTEAVRTKGFIIGILVAPLLMSGSILAMVLLKGQVNLADKKVAVVDRSGVIAAALVEAAQARNEKEIHDPKTGKQTQPAYLVEIVEPAEDSQAQRVELSRRVKAKELAAFVEIGPSVVHPGQDPQNARIAYHAENAILDDMRGWLAGPINDQLRRLRLAESGLDEAAVPDLFDQRPVEALGLVTVDEMGRVREAQRSQEALAFGVPFILVMLMFLLIMIGSQPLLHSVLDEKTERIAEVLLGSVRPFELMWGKLVGNLGVSFTVAAVYLGGGIVACHYLGLMEYVPFHLLPWFFAYLVAAVSMVGALCIAVGAASNDAKELQSLTLPVMLPVMIPMFVLTPVLKEPLSGFATGLSLVPPFTPILMLLRQATPAGVPVWQPWVGLAGVAAFTFLCVWASSRIFRIGLLMQGQPPTLGTLVRWAVRG